MDISHTYVYLCSKYRSLLDPAIEMAEKSGWEGLAFVPVSTGFLLGALFVFVADLIISRLEIKSPTDFGKQC